MIDPIEFAKMVADETRHEIMMELSGKWLNVSDLVEKLGGLVNQPTVSHHLKKLEEANLVIVKKEGRFRYYTLNQELVCVCCERLSARLAPDQN